MGIIDRDATKILKNTTDPRSSRSRIGLSTEETVIILYILRELYKVLSTVEKLSRVLGGLSQSSNSSLSSDGSRCTQNISATSHDLLASQALPDASRLSLHTAEMTMVNKIRKVFP